MPPRKNARKNTLATAAVGGRDDISNLPDEVLQHMLSFLPAQDAVRTCVLAKRWRHLWKSTTVLRFVCGGMNEPKSVKEMQDFVDQLLRLRISGGTPPDTCKFHLGIDFGEDGTYKDSMRSIFWIRIALQCKVRVIQFICVANSYPDICPRDDYPFFISQYLKKLELRGLYFAMRSKFLDFSYCPVLEDLEIIGCCLSGNLPISSQSLKHLTFARCYFPHVGGRVSICARNLVSLWLEVCGGRTPWLQRMPLLLTAVVKILSYDDLIPLHSDNDSNQSIVLQGLSKVRNLVLISRTEMCVFRRDLKFCSGFNKLKSLLINEYWCEPADFSALACLLKLSPVLEKLTLQLYSEGPEHNVEIQLNCKPLVTSAAISQHLKTIEVKCEVYDERVRNVLTFLNKLDIWFEFSGQKALHEDGPTMT